MLDNDNMDTKLYNLIFKHSCSKGQNWLQKNKSLKLRDLVNKFYTDKIDFLRFISIRQTGQRLCFDENETLDTTTLNVAKALSDPQESIYTANDIIKILDRFNMPD